MGSARIRMPESIAMPVMILPTGVTGKQSPYPTVVIDTKAHQ